MCVVSIVCVRFIMLTASKPGAIKFSVREKASPSLTITHCGLLVKFGVIHSKLTAPALPVF